MAWWNISGETISSTYNQTLILSTKYLLMFSIIFYYLGKIPSGNTFPRVIMQPLNTEVHLDSIWFHRS